MKQKLGLPSITKPPAAVPPKIYNILYKQFSEALFPSTSGATANKTPISTPKNNRKIDHQQQLQQGQNNAPLPPPLCPSPTKRSSSLFAGGAGKGGGGNSMSGINSPHKPSAKNLNTLSQFVPNQKLEKQLPSTAYHTMISDFCNTFQNPQLVSHIVSGFNFISNSFKYSPLAKNPYALIGALYIVIYQLTGFSSSSSNSALKHGTTEQRYAAYLAHRKRVVEELGSYLHGFSAKEFESLIRELLTDDMRETPWWRRLEEEQQQQQEQDSQIEQQQGIQKTSGEQKGQSIVLVGRGRGEGGEVDAKQIVTLPRKRRQNESGSGVGSMVSIPSIIFLEIITAFAVDAITT